MNPFAVGHMVNHPPPDITANVKFVDFDLPYTFFPSSLGRYIPYINSRETVMKRSAQAETRSNDVMRAIAMVSQQIISDGDELYVDYIQDNRTEINYTPDWLLEPPSPSPYLQKKEMISEIPLAVKALIFWDQTKKGRTYDEFEGRTQ